MKLMRVTAVDYITEDEETIVQLAGRDEQGERSTHMVEGCVPYFYAPEQVPIEDSEQDWVTSIDFEDEDGVSFESFEGTALKRISTITPKKAGLLADRMADPWESDIPFYRRATIDYALSGHIRVPEQDRCHIDDIECDVEVSGDAEIDPRVFIADIEVLQDGNKSFEEMKEKAEDPISHITVWDSKADEYVVLYLDPDDSVQGGAVSEILEEQAGEAMAQEIKQDIHLRAYETEEALLRGFVGLFEKRRPDLVSGWNFVDFDWDYLLSRFEKFDGVNEHKLSDIGWIKGYQTERKVDCVPAFDMMDAYCDKMSWSEWRTTRLDYVAKVELGVGKISNVNINWAYENDRDKLTAYNIVDVMLCVALDRREGIHDFFYELAELSQVQIYDTFSEMRLVDGRIMSRAGPKEILPPQREKDIPDNAGGLVLDPSDGVKEWVGVIDLKSLYPSAIITWNISPETIHWYEDEPPQSTLGEDAGYIDVPWLPDADHAEGGEFAEDDIHFDVMWTDLKEEGLIPKYLKELFPERAERKQKRNQYDPDDPLYDVWDRKQAAVKVIMNSFYGVMSNDYWRLGRFGLGDAVTSTARYALWQGKEIAQDEGRDVIYGDTDSVMVSLATPGEGKDAALERGEKLEEIINGRMDECVERSGLHNKHPHIDEGLHGTGQHALVYEFEKLYRRFFQAGSKKRYGGRIVWKEGKDVDGEIDTVGFESQRSDSPELTEEVQPEVINRILAGDEFSEVSEYIQQIIEDIESRDIELYKVGLPSTINQPLDEYGNTQTARACRYGNAVLDGEWSQGDDPWLYFIRRTPPMTPDTDVLALEWDEDLPDEFELNLDKVLERALEGPLSPILGEVGWKFTELKKGAQTQSAADWSTDYDSGGDDPDDPDDDPDDEGGETWGW